MYQPKMKLTAEEYDILSGKAGEVKAKLMETIVMFGDMFEAPRLVKVTYPNGHLVTSFGLGLLKPVYRTMDELIQSGLKTEGYFTVDPRPYDPKNIHYSLIDKLINAKILYSMQKKYENQLMQVGLKNQNGFTCACYFPEVGNIPKTGDILSWAESSAVNYANSVLGARCNRNSGMIDLFGSILGYVPEFGLLTDEGRKASWKVIIKTTKKPEAQILGSAIGIKVVEAVPYIIGLDKWLGSEMSDDVKSYLKDMGAATASNGAVGLYYVDKLTPEAKLKGQALIKEDAMEYIIDDKEMERIYQSYPIMWKDQDKEPQICFIGCPHLSLNQLNNWTDRIVQGLKNSNHDKVLYQTVLTTAPDVFEEFKKTPKYLALLESGCELSSICPLMYTSNPLTKKRRMATCSNKLRTYSFARFYKEEDLLNLIVGRK